MAQRKIIIHNHIPARRTRDEAYRVKGSGSDWFVQSNKEEEVGDRNFKTKAEAEAFKRQLESKSRDAKDAELNYSEVMKGWMFRVGGKNYGPYPDEAKAQVEMAKAKGANDSPLTPAEEKADRRAIGQARATGEHLAEMVNTTKEVRDYCRSKNISRALEAYVVDSFKYARLKQGLSENV